MSKQNTIVCVNRDSYAVRTPDGVVNCKARGVFRKGDLSPATGDRVTLEHDCITAVEKRSSFLPRPPVANFDRLALVVAAVEPKPSPLVIDKLLAVAEDKGVEPILIFNKSDLADVSDLQSIYRSAGFVTVVTDAKTGTGISELRELLRGHFTVFIGNSGVGKSSLLNCLLPEGILKTGEISHKLGRGRHTTRTCEIVMPDGDTMIADTPGFAAVDIAEYVTLYPDGLWQTFREFAPYAEKCRFRLSCTHTKEAGCEVLAAVERGEISASRFHSYLTLYEQVKDNRPWNIKDKK